MTTITRPPASPASKGPSARKAIAFTTKVAAIRNLLAYTTDLAHLHRAQGLLSWDQQTQMPPGGIGIRGQVNAAVAGIAHGLEAAPRYGKLIEKAERALAESPERFSDADRALARDARRNFDISCKFPDAFVRTFAAARPRAFSAWQQAKTQRQFALFAPSLKELVDLSRQRAHLLDPQAVPYAVLFDLFEPGMPLDDCRTILETVRAATVKLLKRVRAARPIDTSAIQGRFPEAQQLAIARTMLETIGYRFENGRIDLAPHPFESSMGSPYDVRVTTRYSYKDIGRAIMPAIHEGGHALYEQGIDPALAGTMLAHGTSLGLHESQSRGWENVIGRSLPFWQAHFSKVQAAFPGSFDALTPEQFVRSLNAVEPQPIRVEADELTYNLHIIIRFELEQELINGQLEAEQARDAWNQKYHDYLGVDPADDAEGVLQDIHWSSGNFGYFSTYSLGNFYAAQFVATLRRAFPDMDARLARGETQFIREWQREHIHRWGSIYRAGDLCERVTGERLNPQYFIAYVTEKVERLYGLQ